MEDRRAHERIDNIEQIIAAHFEEHVTLEKNLAENTRLTRHIAENTRELVDLVKGIRGFRALVLWAAPLVAAGIAVVAWVKGGK